MTTAREKRHPLITTQGVLTAVVVAVIIGAIIQYSVSGTLIGWWLLAPLPFSLAGEVIWSRERRRRA